MTIRGKLYTAIVVTVAGLALTAGTGIWAMDRLGDRFEGVQAAADARALALELKFDVTNVNGWQTAYGYDGGRSRPTFLKAVARFRATLAQARRELTRPQEARHVREIEDAFDDFMRLDAQATPLSRRARPRSSGGSCSGRRSRTTAERHAQPASSQRSRTRGQRDSNERSGMRGRMRCGSCCSPPCSPGRSWPSCS